MSPHPDSTLVDRQSRSASANADDAAARFAPRLRPNTKERAKTMENFTAATAITAAFVAAFLGLAGPAAAVPWSPKAAPSGTSAADTIAALEADGNRVIVNRQGSTALDDAVVVSVRQGQPIREYVWDAQGDDRVLQTTGHVFFLDVK